MRFLKGKISERIQLHTLGITVNMKKGVFRLLKNAQMQGSRNPEECGVLGRTPQ